MSVALALAIRRRDKARERLFAAGWKPIMAYQTTQAPEHHDLLLELNARCCDVTKQAMRR